MSIISLVRTALFGDPPSADYEPSKEGLLKAFEELVRSLDTVVGGIAADATVVYETLAELEADLVPAEDTLGLVYDDADETANGVYIKVGATTTGSWVFTGLLARGPAGQSATIDAEIALDHSRNLFDTDDVVSGQEAYGDGTLQPEANSYTSGSMLIRGARYVSISGLGINVGFARYVHFIGADGTTSTGVTTIPDGLNAAFLTVPADTYYLRFSPRQRVAGSADFSLVRVYASNATWAGKKVVILGDSISEMSDVDSGDYLFEESYDPGSGYETEYRVNWPYYALPRMLPSRVRLYAKSGAHFADAAGLTTEQKFSTQVANVIADAANAPDVIIVAFGTNDWGNSVTSGGGSVVLGDAATALATDYGSLDPTISIQGMRKGVHLLRYWFPDAVIFGVTPMQRGDFNPINGMDDWIEEIRLIYRYYGCEIIDQFTELGVNYMFEQTAPGPHLSDQLHPSTAGMILQADLITARYRARMGGTG